MNKFLDLADFLAGRTEDCSRLKHLIFIAKLLYCVWDTRLQPAIARAEKAREAESNVFLACVACLLGATHIPRGLFPICRFLLRSGGFTLHRGHPKHGTARTRLGNNIAPC
jgi:hypothetical protein